MRRVKDQRLRFVKQSGAFGCSVLVAVASILEGGALGVGTAVCLAGAFANFDGIQRAVTLAAGMVSAGLNGTSDFVIDVIHGESLLIVCGHCRLIRVCPTNGLFIPGQKKRCGLIQGREKSVQRS